MQQNFIKTKQGSKVKSQIKLSSLTIMASEDTEIKDDEYSRSTTTDNEFGVNQNRSMIDYCEVSCLLGLFQLVLKNLLHE